MNIEKESFYQELKELADESIGWIPLEDRAYLHLGDADATVVLVTGVPDADLAHLWVLLMG